MGEKVLEGPKAWEQQHCRLRGLGRRNQGGRLTNGPPPPSQRGRPMAAAANAVLPQQMALLVLHQLSPRAAQSSQSGARGSDLVRRGVNAGVDRHPQVSWGGGTAGSGGVAAGVQQVCSRRNHVGSRGARGGFCACAALPSTVLSPQRGRGQRVASSPGQGSSGTSATRRAGRGPSPVPPPTRSRSLYGAAATQKRAADALSSIAGKVTHPPARPPAHPSCAPAAAAPSLPACRQRTRSLEGVGGWKCGWMGGWVGMCVGMWANGRGSGWACGWRHP